jgi:hypothetical protein
VGVPLTQGIGLRPKPWAGLYRPVGPGFVGPLGRDCAVGLGLVTLGFMRAPGSPGALREPGRADLETGRPRGLIYDRVSLFPAKSRDFASG